MRPLIEVKRPGLEVVLPSIHTDDEPEETESPDRRFICVFCSHTIAAPDDVVAIDGSSVHEFLNPEGVLFRICCFLRAEGCFASGESTFEFTWFKGYSWRFAHCRGCGVQLGWRFDASAHGFFGLIIKHLAEGG